MKPLVALLAILAISATAGPIITITIPPAAGGGAWADTNYQRRIKLTINGSTEVDSTLTNFPVYVRLSDLPDSFHDNIEADGDDVRVYEDDHTTELHVEMVEIDTTAKDGEMHFLDPSIGSVTNSDVWIYYDYTSAVAYANPQDVWDATGADYMAVWHLNESGTTDQPSATGDANIDLEDFNLESGDSTTGKLGNAIDYDGSNEYHRVPSSMVSTLKPDSTGTLECWINSDSWSGSDQIIAFNDGSSKGIGIWRTSTDLRPTLGDNTSDVYNNLNQATSGLSTGTWYHIAVTWGSGTAKLYFDGAEVDSYSWSGNPVYPNADFRVARWSGYFNGRIDEIRLHDTKLSADWLDAQFTNQSTPTTFYTIGTEETQ